MYVLEIETRDQVKRIENPRKARIVDGFYKERLEEIPITKPRKF